MKNVEDMEDKLADNEVVHFIFDYWDGPREGVADYMGTPHYFKAVFDAQRDEWSDVFIVSLLDSETYNLLKEIYQIWQRWQKAYESGAASLDSHPSLPEDAKRQNELAEIIERKAKSESIASMKLKGSFEADDRTKLTNSRQWRVRWLQTD